MESRASSRAPHRRAVLHGLAVTAVAGPAAAQASDTGIAFVALGDWGHGGGRQQADVAVGLARAAEELGSRFVVSVGDNFYPCGVRSTDDPQWASSFENVYSAPALQAPWYVALGNHDHRGSPSAQIAYSRLSPRWRMPGRYFAIEGAQLRAPQLDLFVIDTTPLLDGYGEVFQELRRGRRPSGHAKTQLLWLDSALRESSAEWKIVIGHHPIRSGGHHGGSPELLERIEPLLAAHGVQAYLNGHDHVLQHIRAGGLDHVCTGAGGSAGHVRSIEGTLFRHAAPGFATFTLTRGSLRLDFRDATGRTLYEAAIPMRQSA